MRDKRAAPFRHMGDAEPHDVLGRPAGDALAVEADVAAGPDHAAQRAQRGGLAGAVGAEQGDDAALVEREIEPVQGVVLPVQGVEAREPRASSGAVLSCGLAPR